MGGESMTGSAVFVGIATFAAAGVIWYVYFYQKEKRLLQRLYDIIEQAEYGEVSTDMEMMSQNNIDHIDKNKKTKGAKEAVTEEKVSMVEDKFHRFVNNSLLENENNRQQKQVIQGLISDISHQTLTPIANLKLYAELLQETVCAGTEDGAAARLDLAELTATLCGQTEKLDFLIQSLVKLSRMETGLIGVRPQRVKIQGLFDAVHREYDRKAAERGISLTFEETSLEAFFDLKWTGEALGNIVDNAVKYTQAGGKVYVSAQAYTFFVRIDVADNGIGIAAEEFHKIFSRFYRSLSADDQPGVGIGLYLAREIVRAQRGYIKVASKEGKGTVFSVFLPVAVSSVMEFPL